MRLRWVPRVRRVRHSMPNPRPRPPPTVLPNSVHARRTQERVVSFNINQIPAHPRRYGRCGLGQGETAISGYDRRTWVGPGRNAEGVRAPVDNAGRRQFALAQEKDVHDERLWMGITKATGALGNTSCLVGTAEQVADSLLAYYRLGVSSFLIRGFDPVSDTIEFGRELIPRLRAGVLEIDRQVAQAG